MLQGDDARHMSRMVPAPVPRSVEKTRVDESVKAIAYKHDEQALTLLFVDEPPFSNAPNVQRGWKRANPSELSGSGIDADSRSLQHSSEQASEGVRGQDVMVGTQTPPAL